MLLFWIKSCLRLKLRFKRHLSHSQYNSKPKSPRRSHTTHKNAKIVSHVMTPKTKMKKWQSFLHCCAYPEEPTHPKMQCLRHTWRENHRSRTTKRLQPSFPSEFRRLAEKLLKRSQKYKWLKLIVKPVYKSPWDPKIVDVVDRWSLFRGH